jgi:hypothetical protein
MSTGKHLALNAAFKDYLFTNSTRQAFNNNKDLLNLFKFNEKGIAEIVEEGGLKRFTKSFTKNFVGEALDEHLDEDIKNFTNGFYNMETWLSRDYNPETSNYTLNYLIDDFISGLDSF